MISRNDILKMAGLDTDLEVFGAKIHRYKIGEPLTQGEIQGIEQRYRIVLPEDYREYLLTIGNGGAGPFHGVLKFWKIYHLRGYQSYEESEEVGDLSLPCSLETAWNLPESDIGMPEIPDGISLEEEDAINDAYHKKIEEIYWSPTILNGCIPISNQGCARRTWLIVNGSKAGTIWNDSRSDLEGIRPVMSRSGGIMTFAEWMAVWVEDPLGHAERLS